MSLNKYMTIKPQSNNIQCGIFQSPLGAISVVGDKNGISEISFNNEKQATKETSFVDAGMEQLAAYFDGQLKSFDLKLNMIGTDFQKAVWDLLLQIPFGKTVSYADIAKDLGDSKKVRAVGMANGRNPIAIVVPCHRVIGSDGQLTGYASGIDRKKKLLQLEGSWQQLELF